MTERMRAIVERARAFVDGNTLTEQPGYAGMFSLAREFAELIIQLESSRPAKGDVIRIDRREYTRASSNAACVICNECGTRIHVAIP